MENIGVIGAGVMGSALAIHLGNNGHRVNLWGTKWDGDFIKEMESSRQHKGFDIDLPESISLFYDYQLEEALKGVKLIVIAVISKGMESICKTIAPYLRDDNIILSVTKGIDGNSLDTMSTLIEKTLSSELRSKVSIVKLGGPIIAGELARSKYTEGVLASSDLKSARYVGLCFKSPKFKINISQDLQGVDLCAALKNTYAIGMGIIEGLEEASNNPKAALMARGSVEMANIVKACGGKMETALGIAGVGDYYVTSQGGRNGRFGKLLGQGNTINEALEIMEHQTVEGLDSTLNGYRLLEKLEREGRLKIDEGAPLFREIYNILYRAKSVGQAIDSYWAEDL